MTDPKTCNCNGNAGEVAVHAITCPIVAAAEPNAMVTPDGLTVFYADGPEDALAYYAEHQAVPVNPDLKPELWQLIPAEAWMTMAPTTGGPYDNELPDGCTGHYREDIDRGDVLIHTGPCPVHNPNAPLLEDVLGEPVTTTGSGASTVYLALTEGHIDMGCVCPVVEHQGDTVIKVDGHCPVHGRTPSFTFDTAGAAQPFVSVGGLVPTPASNATAMPPTWPVEGLDGSKESLRAYGMRRNRHPGVVDLLGHMAWSHLRPDLQPISAPFGQLATAMVDMIPDSAELTAGLRKLLEAKDCMVRAAL